MESKIKIIKSLTLELVIIPFIFMSCFMGRNPTAKNTNYAYRSEVYEVFENTRHNISFGNFISYDSALFEFIITRRDTSEIVSETETILKSTTYDTTGVYLLANNSKYYIQFDTFAIKSSIVKTGRLENKPNGEKLETNSAGITGLNNISFKDTLLFNQPYYYLDTTSAVKEMADTAEVKLFFIKNKYLNTIYKIYGKILPDKEFCMAGVGVYLRKLKSNTMFIVKDLRPVTHSEEKICRALLQKARYAVTDTIQ